MRTFITLFLFSFLIGISYAQDQAEEKRKLESPQNAVTIGLLQGGSLIGFDYEFRVNDRFGVQVGTGIFGFAAGVNYHFTKATNGPFLSISYKNPGFGYMSTIGPEYGRRWFFNDNWGISLQVGYGHIVSKSDEFKKEFEKDKTMNGLLTYSLGIVF
jgi:hypothetical protein